VSAANRRSLRARFFSRRFADFVPFFCNLARSLACRARYRFSWRPEKTSPSDVVAMSTMPRSTPRKPGRVRVDLRFRNLAGRQKVELTVSFDEVRLALAVLAQDLQVVRTPDEPHALQPAGRRPNGHRPGVVLPGEESVVVRPAQHPA